jgi:DNA polymerase-3 subunit beta
MRFRVERDALADALAWVARALPSRPVVPVLSGLRLEAGDGLTLSCFDYEVSATAHLDADVEEAGTALVPGRLLAEITRSLPALAADFATDGDAVNLTCGSAEFTIVQLPGDDYPALPEPPPLAGTVDGGELAVAIGQVLPAASRDDTLPMLTGVCLDINGGTVTLAATDRYRLAVREVEWHPISPGLRAVALAPARTLADAARTMTPGSAVTIAFETAHGGPGARRGAGGRAGASQGGEGQGGRAGAGADREPRPAEGMISFGMGGRRLTARLIGGEFIRYRSRFPSEFGCLADVPAGPFIEAVRRVSLVADRASPVRLEFGVGKVVIEAQTEGRARAVETVPAEFHGDQPVISFNPHYLLDGLAAAAAPGHQRHAPEPGETKESADGPAAGEPGPADPGLLRLEFTSPAKPALITWVQAPATQDSGTRASETQGSETQGSETQGSGTQGSETQDGGTQGSETQESETEGSETQGSDGEDEGRLAGVPPFRYLVVPLRTAVRS